MTLVQETSKQPLVCVKHNMDFIMKLTSYALKTLDFCLQQNCHPSNGRV